MDQWLLCRSCRGKILSCSTTLATGCTYKSRGIVVGSVQAVAAIANDESLHVRVRKAHPPEGRSSLHPSAHKGARTGCALTLRNAASLQKHCPVACKARVKQVRPWTYPSMCSLYKIGNVGHQQRELRFPLGILHCHSLPPACWERGAEALIPIGSLYRECRKQVGDSTQCLHISLDVASWRSAYAPFPPRKHCWPLVQVLESLLSINHWHRPAKIGAIWADRVAHICQRHWVGHMSLAMFYFFLACVLLEVACNLQKRVAQCKAGMVEWKPPVERYT